MWSSRRSALLIGEEVVFLALYLGARLCFCGEAAATSGLMEAEDSVRMMVWIGVLSAVSPVCPSLLHSDPARAPAIPKAPRYRPSASTDNAEGTSMPTQREHRQCRGTSKPTQREHRQCRRHLVGHKCDCCSIHARWQSPALISYFWLW